MGVMGVASATQRVRRSFRKGPIIWASLSLRQGGERGTRIVGTGWRFLVFLRSSRRVTQLEPCCCRGTMFGLESASVVIQLIAYKADLEVR